MECHCGLSGFCALKLHTFHPLLPPDNWNFPFLPHQNLWKCSACRQIILTSDNFNCVLLQITSSPESCLQERILQLSFPEIPVSTDFYLTRLGTWPWRIYLVLSHHKVQIPLGTENSSISPVSVPLSWCGSQLH